MGKKKSGSNSGAAKVSRDWSASAISNRDINRLRALGFISASKEDIRLPSAVSRPRPAKGFNLWQLTPNSILHLSIFITVCEAFLGIDPHWGLWRKIFYVKRHNDSNGPPVVGGVGFVVRKEVDYFDYPMKESVQGWRNKCAAANVSTPPIMALYGKDDKSRVSSADLSADELQDEVRRLTCLSMKDNIILTSARPPYDFDHLPYEAPSVVRCYPPTPESGVEPEDDDDDSEGTEDAQQVFEDSDVQEGDTAEEVAFTRSKRRLQIDEDFITTAESSPNDQDNDAVGTPPPSPVNKGPSGFFAAEDDLELSDDDLVPLAKRAKLSAERASSAKEPNPSPAKSTPPTRTTVEKIPVSKVIPLAMPYSSASRSHFAEALPDEAENAHLRKTIKSSADQC
ncbi:hypothetical protein QYE76_052221 [Lolium multiflorum]|uniref:Transposase (putative) gypsy type domain-containing protein n=1 Tax=Lolium multiflorum TaxID=4521 RepID=A0AAD8STH6_LOLMU|nr:hypothetical protein QYE76_052221 [Lolium multiflorum]